MPDFDPEKDNGWSLRETIMRAGSPLLASVAQKRLELGEQPPWWMPQLAPEPPLERGVKYDYLNPQRDYELTVEAVVTAFRIKLINGELVCWARPGAPHENHKKLARDAWGGLVVEDWIFGTLRACTRDARMDFVPVPGGFRYYGARIEPVQEVEAEVASPDRPDARTLSEHDVRRWLDQRAAARRSRPWQGQGLMWDACKSELGGRFGRERFNALRAAVMKRDQIERPSSGPWQNRPGRSN